MKYSLVYTRRAAQDIEAIDPVARKRLGKKLLWLAEDPIRRSKKLIKPEFGTYRYRIGAYRVIFDIDKSNIVILRVGHRREIYR